MDELLDLQSIQKRYGNKLALDLEHLSLRSGRLYLLTGSNGSGKTTLLHILALLSQPDGGRMTFAGETVAWTDQALTRLRKQTTLLHQSPYLFSGNVFKNLAFGLKLRGIHGALQKQAVAEALALVGLEGFEKRKAQELSGGEAQRVALARALALKPKLLLLDEPLANVDRKSASMIENLIATLPERGTTVVMSTHDPQLPERLAGEQIQLVNGRLKPIMAPVPACDQDIWGNIAYAHV